MKRLLQLVVMAAVGCVLHAQTKQDAIDHIIRQLQIFPQEKTYIHADAADYAPGDRIWLKVYVVNALSHEPTSESLYAYIELTQADGTLSARAKLLCRDGVYAGYLDIPESLEGGQYLIRSYTDASMNTPDYESVTPIYIGGRQHRHRTRAKSRPSASNATVQRGLSYQRTGSDIIVSTSLADDSLTLLAHCRAYPFVYSHIDRRHPVVINSDSIPQGVVSLLLLNTRQQVVAEQLLFSDNGNEQCPLVITTDQDSYAPASPVKLQLRVPDLHQGEQADISVSVTSTVTTRRHRPASIVAHLLLGSDVADGVDTPERYLAHTLQADSLLADKRWTRYDFGRVLQGNYATPKYHTETTHTISGQVKTPTARHAVVGGTVSIIAPQVAYMATTQTDNTGCFAFHGMDFADGTQYVLRATNEKQQDHVVLTVDEKERPDFRYAYEGLPVADDIYMPGDTTMEDLHDAILLSRVEVTGTRRNSASEGNLFAQMADASFGLHKIEEIGATCIHELLRRLPGVRVDHNRCYIRAATSIFGDNPAAVAIDGIIVQEDYDLDNILMQDVARVDVFKTGKTVIWGSAGGSGVISITTKLGHYEHTAAETPNLKKVRPAGYQLPANFYAQSRRDRTLYWNPHVVADTVELTTAEAAGKCHVVVEGVTTEGRLIHEEKDILVRNHSNSDIENHD